MFVVPLEPQPLKKDEVAKAQLFTPIHRPDGSVDGDDEGVLVGTVVGEMMVDVAAGCGGAVGVGVAGRLAGGGVAVAGGDAVGVAVERFEPGRSV